MYLHTAEPKTIDQFIARLSEVEKIQIRMATPGALDHMRQTIFYADGPLSEAAMYEVQRQLLVSFTAFGDVHFKRGVAHA